MVREPNRNNSHGNNLRDETLDITIAIAALHVEPDLPIFALFTLLVIANLGYRRILHVHNIHASEVQLFGNLDTVDE
jgi:hypothetical protein